MNKVEIEGKEEKEKIGVGSLWLQYSSSGRSNICILRVGASFGGVNFTFLTSGNYWGKDIVVNNRDNLTVEEWKRVKDGGDFTRITTPIKITPEV